VIQGAAVATIVLNTIALWRQESLIPSRTGPARPSARISAAAGAPSRAGDGARACCSRSASAPPAFSMQDILLEPYGGEVLGMSVSATTGLTAIWGLGMLIAFAIASRARPRRRPDPPGGYGAALGTFAFAA
jgi:BCD family chlorophyll transporter-like MFS transporter